MAPQQMQEEKPSNAKVMGVVSFYIVAAIMMVTVNKAVLISSPIPIFFLFCQLSIAVLLLLLCRTLRLLSLPPWNTNTALRLWPLIAVNVLGLIFNNLCLQYVDASFYQIARGLVLPITVVLSFAMQSSPPSMHATLCCVGITLGFAVGVMYDNHASARAGQMHTSFIGVTFGILSSCTTAFHSIVIKKTLPIVNGSTIHLAWYTNLLSTVAIVPAIFIMGEVPEVMRVLAGGEGSGSGTFFWGSIVTGVVGFLICIAGFLSIKVTSPVTHMVSSAARGVVQTLLSVWAFGDIISGARATSIFLITLASMAYVWVKHAESKAPPSTPLPSGGSSSTLFDKDRDMPLDRRDRDAREEAEKEDQVPLLNKGSEQV